MRGSRAAMSYSWQDKVVIITGAASGIGERVVRNLLEESVKHVAFLDVAEDVGTALQNELNQKYGINKVKFFKCDVTNDAQVFEAFDWVKNNYGYIDVVINNAGIMNDSLPVYKKQIEINVTALVTLTLKALELMRKDEGGHGGTIINISSIAALSRSPLMPVYWATKSAVIQFSNCIGHSETYSRTGVRVLSICYGATGTPLLSQQKLGSFDKKLDNILEDALKEYSSQSPEEAARGTIEAYKKADSGTVWLITSGRSAMDITKQYDALYDGLEDLLKMPRK